MDHVPYIGDQTPVLDAIEDFVTGGRRAPVTDRFLATAMFTDIVGSTETAGRLGDARWGELLQAHHVKERRAPLNQRAEELGSLTQLICLDQVQGLLNPLDVDQGPFAITIVAHPDATCSPVSSTST